jgi:hypothetical protein
MRPTPGYVTSHSAFERRGIAKDPIANLSASGHLNGG